MSIHQRQQLVMFALFSATQQCEIPACHSLTPPTLPERRKGRSFSFLFLKFHSFSLSLSSRYFFIILFLSFSSFLTFFLFLARFYSDFLSFRLSFPALVSTNSFVVFVVRPEQKFIDSSEILRKFEDFRRYFRISIIFRWIWEAASIYYGRSFLYSIFYFGWGFTNLKLERRKFLFFIVI